MAIWVISFICHNLRNTIFPNPASPDRGPLWEPHDAGSIRLPGLSDLMSLPRELQGGGEPSDQVISFNILGETAS
ncbi:MAG: hypothetical protein L0Y80_05075 [Ignavibacteriae bacterium]|nr:hypothetical protein [Ignavibacteriota bacterium]